MESGSGAGRSEAIRNVYFFDRQLPPGHDPGAGSGEAPNSRQRELRPLDILVLVASRVHARLDTTICKYCVIFKLGSRGRIPGRVLPWQPTAPRRSPPPQGRQSCSAHRIL
jgi:hypothetical protein